MIRATLRSALVLNGVRALSANSVPQLHKPITCMLVPRVEGTLSQRKMCRSFTGMFSQPALPTDEVTKLTNDVKPDVEKAAKRSFLEYTPVLFSEQFSTFILSEGTKYHVKVQTGEVDYIEVLYRTGNDFGQKPHLWFDGFVDHRTRYDPIRPYDQLIGGWTDVSLPTREIESLVQKLKPEVEKKTGMNFEEFKAVLYRMQVVGGYIYLVKVHTGGSDYLHMMIFEGLPRPGILQPLQLSCVQYPKKKEDPLVPCVN